MIMPYFSESERHSAELDIVEKRNDFVERIRTYNRRFSGKPSVYLGKGILLDIFSYMFGLIGIIVATKLRFIPLFNFTGHYFPSLGFELGLL